VPVHFHSELSGFTLKDKKKIREWISETIADHSFKTGDLNFVFCDDEYLHKINLQYLDHDTYTDIITFPAEIPGKEDRINGDIFISVERVRENASKFKSDPNSELLRVIIHGVLHLCGQGDKTAAESKKMRKKEEIYLARYK
jgi:probable rRNA maturation factor